jgi:hypothetical protein
LWLASTVCALVVSFAPLIFYALQSCESTTCSSAVNNLNWYGNRMNFLGEQCMPCARVREGLQLPVNGTAA